MAPKAEVAVVTFRVTGPTYAACNASAQQVLNGFAPGATTTLITATFEQLLEPGSGLTPPVDRGWVGAYQYEITLP